jgi:tRNA A-37 threonylcarbamoyl transferase component Bud32
MVKCRRAGVLTPAVYLIDETSYRIFLEFIEGPTLRNYIQQQGINCAVCVVSYMYLSFSIQQTAVYYQILT